MLLSGRHIRIEWQLAVGGTVGGTVGVRFPPRGLPDQWSSFDSSISVTSAAIALRSERVRVT